MSDRAPVWAAGRQADRALALVRIAALPVILAGERLVEHHPAQSELFVPILAVAAAYAVGALFVGYVPGGEVVPGSAYAALDLAFICALTYTSGGPFSQLRYAFFFLPLGAALLLGPRYTTAASLAAVLAYVLIALVHPATGDLDEAVRLEVVFALYLMWIGLAAVLLSFLLTRRTDEVRELAESRGRLVAQALDAEDHERRRLAEALHDEAIQNLLAARQELSAANGHDLDLVRLGLDRTVEQLRDAVFDLHPYVLEHAGLTAALEALAEHQARRARFRWQVEVDEAAAGVHDQLVFSIARELVVNAAKHAGASELRVSVRRLDGDIVLEVADDGRGIDPRRVAAAPLAGHIGLASCAERVEALDGSLEIGPREEGGTRIRVTVPAEAALLG
jgi:two-component system NarL family sensor kinase